MTSQLPFEDVPVNRTLGFRLVSHDRAGATVSFRPERAHTQEYGVVHGGILSALADTAAVYTVYPFLDPSDRMTSIEFKINFLSGVTPERGEVVARATVKKQGRTLAVVQVDVHQGDVQAATGLFTYIIFRALGVRREAVRLTSWFFAAGWLGFATASRIRRRKQPEKTAVDFQDRQTTVDGTEPLATLRRGPQGKERS